MTRKLSLVTGSYSGIGRALCRQLLQAGRDLILLNRDVGKTRSQVDELSRQYPDAVIRTYQADLADQASIRSAAGEIGKAHGAIDEVYLVAGALCETGQVSADGLELHFAVNCVAPVLLVRLLRPQLKAASGRVVVAGSSARKMVRELSPGEAVTVPGRGGMGAYAQSKQAITAAFAALRDTYAEDGISLVVVDLPPTRTDMAASPALPLPFRLLRFLFASPDKSAARLISAGREAARDGGVRHDASDVARLMALIDSSIMQQPVLATSQ